jgi:hypothetical protein
MRNPVHRSPEACVHLVLITSRRLNPRLWQAVLKDEPIEEPFAVMELRP